MPTATFPNFCWAFVPIDSMNVRTTFEIRSFTCFWDNRGQQQISGSTDYGHTP